MLSNQAGPRDWSPRYPTSSAARSDSRWIGHDITVDSWQAELARSRGRGRASSSRSGAAWVSFLCGVIGMLLCIAHLGNSSTSTGFIASTVGITAIAYGLHALSLYKRGLGGGRDVARTGIAFGVISTLVMAYFVVSFYFPSVVTPVGMSPAPLSIGSTQPATQQAALPGATPVEPTLMYATEEDERMALAQQVGTLSYVIAQSAPGGLVPEALLIDESGRVVTSSGQVLGRIDLGAQLSYAVSSDRSNYSLNLVGSQFGSVVTYDSLSGTVLTQRSA